MVFEPICAHVLFLYIAFIMERINDTLELNIQSLIVQLTFLAVGIKPTGIIVCIYAMHISEISSSHCSGISTQVILWQLMPAVIKNLIKYSLIIPFSESNSSGGWFRFSNSLFTWAPTAKHGCFLAPFEYRHCSSASQSSGVNRPADEPVLLKSS